MAVDSDGGVYLGPVAGGGRPPNWIWSADGGQTWGTLFSGTPSSNGSYTRAITVSDDWILLAAENGALYRAPRQTRSFTQVATNLFGTVIPAVTKLEYFPELDGFVAASESKLYESTADGRAWREIYTFAPQGGVARAMRYRAGRLFVAADNGLHVLRMESTTARPAAAVAQVVNGFMVGATVSDGGAGYTNAPAVTITGGNGSGATAQATVVNGSVTKITILTPGSGYTETPQIVIAPPPFPPRRALASATVVNSFVVSVELSDGGFGYTAVPAVRITGGGGSGATAVAVVENGVVTGITITNPGSGYTGTPKVSIASPLFSPELKVAVSRVTVTSRVVLGLKYLLESSQDLQNWTAVGEAFTAENEELDQEYAVGETGQFFRITQVP